MVTRSPASYGRLVAAATAAAALASLALAGTASGACAVPGILTKYDDETAMLGGGGGGFVQNSQWIGQQFVVPGTVTIELARISLFMRNETPSGDDVTVQVRSDAGGFPGTQLGSATSSTTDTASFSWLPFDFSALGLQLAAGTPYWIVATNPITTNGEGYAWQEINSATAYPEGISRASSNQGGTWTLPLTADYGFRVLGCAPSPAASAAAQVLQAGPAGDGAPAAAITRPSNTFSLAGKIRSGGDGTLTVVVGVPGPGVVELAPSADVPRAARRVRLRRVRKSTAAAGAVLLRVKASGRAKTVLRRRGRLKLGLRITYTPTGGVPATKTSRATLKLSKR